MTAEGDDAFVYDEASGEWVSAAGPLSGRRDRGCGESIADGDQVTLIKDLNVKGAGP